MLQNTMFRVLPAEAAEKMQVMAWEMPLIVEYAIHGQQTGDVFPCLKYLWPIIAYMTVNIAFAVKAMIFKGQYLLLMKL